MEIFLSGNNLAINGEQIDFERIIIYLNVRQSLVKFSPQQCTCQGERKYCEVDKIIKRMIELMKNLISHPHFLFIFPLFTSKKMKHHKSFNKLLLQKEELEQKHVHLLQVVESEKTAKWQYTQQCEELASEIRKLRAEVN